MVVRILVVVIRWCLCLKVVLMCVVVILVRVVGCLGGRCLLG